MKSLGIIGFGSFGQFMVPHIKPFFNIFVYDKKPVAVLAKRLGVKSCSLTEAAKKDIVVIAIPVQYFEDCIKKVAKFVRPGSLVLDVSSVKVKPARLMKHYLKDVEIVATHPLFGPNSARLGLKGHKIVVCPVRCKDIRKITRFLTGLGLTVLIRTSQTHDKEMAYVQGLTHFIGRAVTDMHLPALEERTTAFNHLLEISHLLGNDSMDLFLTIENENPYAAKVRKLFLKRITDLEDEIGK